MVLSRFFSNALECTLISREKLFLEKIALPPLKKRFTQDVCNSRTFLKLVEYKFFCRAIYLEYGIIILHSPKLREWVQWAVYYTSPQSLIIMFFYSGLTNLETSVNDWLIFKLSVQTFKLPILIYRRVNFVY